MKNQQIQKPVFADVAAAQPPIPTQDPSATEAASFLGNVGQDDIAAHPPAAHHYMARGNEVASEIRNSPRRERLLKDGPAIGGLVLGATLVEAAQFLPEGSIKTAATALGAGGIGAMGLRMSARMWRNNRGSKRK